MNVRQFAPIEALQSPPGGPHIERAQRHEAITDALRGVDLGAHDERVLGWLVWHLDLTTLRTIVSLIERARTAGMVQTINLEAALRERARGDP